VVVPGSGIVGDPEHSGDERLLLGMASIPVFNDLEEDGLDQVLAGHEFRVSLKKNAIRAGLYVHLIR
jgi:hypothetical protein